MPFGGQKKRACCSGCCCVCTCSRSVRAPRQPQGKGHQRVRTARRTGTWRVPLLSASRLCTHTVHFQCNRCVCGGGRGWRPHRHQHTTQRVWQSACQGEGAHKQQGSRSEGERHECGRPMCGSPTVWPCVHATRRTRPHTHGSIRSAACPAWRFSLLPPPCHPPP
jgi:hypothetical protein